MKKKLFSLLMVAMMVVSLPGCSNSAETSKETTPAAADGTSTAVTKVKVGTSNSFPPYAFLDANGDLTGFDIAVLKEMDARLPQYEFDIQPMDFSTVMVSIDSGAIDMVSNQLVKSEVRKQKYLFPEQYYCLSPLSLTVKKDSGIKSFEDMAGKTINMNPSTYEYSLLMDYNAAHPGKEMVINAVSDLTTADQFKQVSNGQVDAALIYMSTYETVQKELNLDNLMLTDVALVEDSYIMVGKGKEDINTAVDKTLKEMNADKTLSKLSTEYLGQDVFSKYENMVNIELNK